MAAQVAILDSQTERFKQLGISILPIHFTLNPTYVLGGEVGHLGCQNGTILAILNHCVTVMPPIEFWLNPTYSLGDVV